MAQKTFFAVKDLDGDGKHYCAVAFESKLAREALRRTLSPAKLIRLLFLRLVRTIRSSVK